MLLRLEDLYEKYQYFLHQEHPLQHHVALSTIFEMLEVVGRQDLKSDLLQELERQKQILIGYRAHPSVQVDVLDAVLENIEQVSATLVGSQGKTGQTIRENEWLMSVRGRTIIPGGACEFDLPSYYAWQNKPADVRIRDIEKWFKPMDPLFSGILMVLRILRESGSKTATVALSGIFQQKLQGRVYQLLRIGLDPELSAIPESQANKYLLSVRFTLQDGDMKPKPIDLDIPFELTLC
jgi:cell division protein ZapD